MELGRFDSLEIRIKSENFRFICKRNSKSFFFDKFRIYRILYSNNRNAAEIDQSTLVELVERCSPSTYDAFNYRLNRDGFERLNGIQSIKNFRGVCDIEKADYLLKLNNLEPVEIRSSTISIDFISGCSKS